MEKIKTDLPVIVEGKYDKIKLASILDAEIITTDGFGIFKKKEKLSLIKRLSERGVIVLTDSDGAGKLIRAHLSGAVPADKIYNLYIPKIKGKEKRKKEGSKEGTLGVEGIDAETLRSIFETFLKNHAPILANLAIGTLKIKKDGQWRTAFAAEGLIEVRPDEVLIFAQSCEWPEDIDEARAEEERQQAMEKLRQKQSLIEYHQTQIALSRAMAKLQVKRSYGTKGL